MTLSFTAILIVMTSILFSMMSPTLLASSVARILVVMSILLGGTFLVLRTLRESAQPPMQHWETYQPELKDSLIAFVEFRNKLKNGDFEGDPKP